MIFILPPEAKDGESADVARLAGINFKLGDLNPSQWKSQLVDVTLPKFNITTRMNGLKQMTREDLGIEIFEGDRPDFSKLLKLGPKAELYVSQLVHEAVIEVTEEGVEAAAASGAAISYRSIQV